MGTRRSGRWVIVVDTKAPPVFWSDDRAAIQNVCQTVRRTCPDARVVCGPPDVVRAERVQVELRATESGDIGFACGMDMLKGTVVVR